MIIKNIVFTLIVLALWVPFGFAGDVPLTSDGKVPGTPFQALQQQIDELKLQLQNIQLTPGPQGPQGPTGPAATESQEVLDVLCDLATSHNVQPCPTFCTCGPKIVFLSSATYAGGALGGLAGADQKCQALASAAGLRGTFKAWLSTATSGPVDRFSRSDTYGYARVDGQMIATNWADLTDGVLSVPIVKTETGNDLGEAYVWTGTFAGGQPWSANNSGGYDGFCNAWSLSSPQTWATFGVSLSPNEGWTAWYEWACDQPFHIYCFQQ